MANDAKSVQEKLEGNKRNLSNLRFPEDLDTDGNGLIFRISINLPAGSKYLENGQYRPSIDPRTGATETSVYRRSNSTSIKRRFSQNYVRTLTNIDLYMPPNINANYNSDWGTQEVGMAGTLIEAGAGISNLEGWGGAAEAWQVLKQTVPQALANSFAGTLQTLTPFNAEAARKIAQNTIVNPYIEVLFNGVENRSFSYTFKMTPKSESEQTTIKKIIDELKFHRAPELKFGNQTNYWLFPSEFDIQFLNRNGPNPWLFKISTCALTSFNVNYAPDGNYIARKDGAPFSVEMTLGFTELEQLSKESHKRGY